MNSSSSNLGDQQAIEKGQQRSSASKRSTALLGSTLLGSTAAKEKPTCLTPLKAAQPHKSAQTISEATFTVTTEERTKSNRGPAGTPRRALIPGLHSL